MEWARVLKTEELPEDARRVVDVGGRAILVLRHEGQIYAIVAACPHLRLPLKGAKISDHTLTCPWHHSAFDLTSGDVKEWSPWPPALGRMLGTLSREKALKVFPTKVEDGAIWIGIEKGGE